MTKKLRKRISRIGIGAAIYACAILFHRFSGNIPYAPWISLTIFIAAYIVIGGDVVKRAVKNIVKGQVFDENFLMMIATLGAFIVGDYSEAVAVMLFYQVGEGFQSYAVNKSRKSIAELMDIRPDHANVLRQGQTLEVSPEEVAVGEMILVKPGERLPLDGTVIKGNSFIDTMALTGESLPREAGEGSQVISGCVNQSGVLEIRVDKEYGQSTVARILELVENASSKKAETENFITKFAKYYTPIVVICAALLAIVPPLVLGGGFGEWVYRALTFLVISCPCALVISIPLSFFGGLGGASRAGILVKGSNYLEALAAAEIIVMDKTGTLTKGNFAVSRIVPATGSSPEDYAAETDDMTEMSMAERLLEAAAYAESYSSHPIARSLLTAYSKNVDLSRLSDMEEIAGHGIRGKQDGVVIAAGNEKLMARYQIRPEIPADMAGTTVHVARNGKYLGYIVIADEIKADAKAAVRGLQEAGMKKIVMLTGDHQKTADYVAGELGITDVYAELLPGDKVEKVEMLLTETSPKGKLIFVGDGINDAPVLARADIGIAMGGLGSDAAIEAADIVIMNDEPSKITQAIKISHKTLAIVKQNIVFAIGVKILVLLLAAAGAASMWAAVFADVGVAVIAILNAMRVMRVK